MGTQPQVGKAARRKEPVVDVSAIEKTMETTGSPIYLKATAILVGLVALFFVLWIGRDILMPLVLAVLLAIMLNPLVNGLSSRGLNRVLAILLALFVGLAALAGLVYFLSSQIAHFRDTLPGISERFTVLIDDLVRWTTGSLHVKEPVMRAWLTSMKVKGIDNGSAAVGSTLTTIGAVFAFVFLLPVYMFMILFYKPLLLEFVARLFRPARHAMVADVLLRTRTLVQSYLIGLFLEALIVAVLDSVGLMILGIDYAILFGVIAALLNLIPYIGGLVATTLPMLMAFATKSPTVVLLVLALFLFVQFVDNNFIVPRVVASRVKVNALASILVVLCGGALWGIGGMFLAIPLIAIVKVVCDRVEPLKPLGYLLGDDQPHIASTLLRLGALVVRRKKQEA